MNLDLSDYVGQKVKVMHREGFERIGEIRFSHRLDLGRGVCYPYEFNGKTYGTNGSYTHGFRHRMDMISITSITSPNLEQMTVQVTNSYTITLTDEQARQLSEILENVRGRISGTPLNPFRNSLREAIERTSEK